MKHITGFLIFGLVLTVLGLAVGLTATATSSLMDFGYCVYALFVITLGIILMAGSYKRTSGDQEER